MLGKLKISCVLIVLLSIKVYSQATISADTLGYIYFNNLQPLYSPYDSYWITNNKCGNTDGLGNIYFWYASGNNQTYFIGRSKVWQAIDVQYTLFYDHGEEDYGYTDLISFSNGIIMPMCVAYIPWVSVTTNSALLKFSPGTDNPSIGFIS